MKKSEFKKIAMENFKNLNMSDVHKTRLYKYDNIPIKRIKKPTITFIYKTTTEAVDNAYKYYPGYKISILNFADGETVGGGYLNGAKAQEEDLCRKIPELYTSLLHSKKECYPFGPSTSYGYSRVLFTRNMLIKRDKNLKYIKNHNKWRNVSVVSAAAPNIGYKNEDYDVAKINEFAKMMSPEELQLYYQSR